MVSWTNGKMLELGRYRYLLLIAGRVITLDRVPLVPYQITNLKKATFSVIPTQLVTKYYARSKPHSIKWNFIGI